jgi:hypothetical protein
MALTDALSAHHRQPVPLPDKRTVALIGATGRLGEAVLEALIAAPDVKCVALAVAQPLQTSEDKVRPVTCGDAAAPDWRAAAPSDAIIVIDADAPQQHAALPHLAGKRRDAVYTRCTPLQWLVHAQALHAAGVQRLAVVIPADGWVARPEAVRGLLATQDEMTLAALGFAALLVVRPESNGAATAFKGNVGERFALAFLRQLRFMLPQQTPITSQSMARWIVQKIGVLPDGVSVMETSQIAQEPRAVLMPQTQIPHSRAHNTRQRKPFSCFRVLTARQ